MNISCDSLRPDRFSQIRRRGDLRVALEAMDAAEAAGLRPLTVNVVLLAGVNDDEILDFARFARTTGRIVRFIDFMPVEAGNLWSPSQLDELSVRDVMRAGGTDDQIADQFRTALGRKLPCHGINEPGFLRPARTMSMIGG